MTEFKNTPTPLKIGKTDDMRHIGLELDGKITATVWNNHHDAKECQDRAAFIVRAVNAHDGLVDMVRRLSSALHEESPAAQTEGTCCDDLLKQAATVLAAAEAKP